MEMGGVNDPLRGALVYQRHTQVRNVSGQKRVKKIVEETSWIGLGQSRKKKVQDNYSRHLMVSITK